MTPRCPRCGWEMFLRHNRFDGSRFWGCTRFPDCKGTKSAGETEPSPQDVATVPISVLRDARTLTHPDRHPAERHDLATRVTAALNAALQRIPA